MTIYCICVESWYYCIASNTILIKRSRSIEKQEETLDCDLFMREAFKENENGED